MLFWDWIKNALRVAVAPDGSWVVTGADRRVRPWWLDRPGTCIAEINAACAALAVSTHTLQDTVIASGGLGLSLWHLPRRPT